MGQLASTYVGSWLSVLVDLVVIIDALSLSVAIMVERLANHLRSRT